MLSDMIQDVMSKDVAEPQRYNSEREHKRVNKRLNYN